jgi:nucleoside-diphosphate-sugar epimerase
MAMADQDAAGPSVTGAVITHPRRLTQARALAATLPPDVCGVVTDPDPSGPPSELRTALRAWASVPAGSTHHLLMHDDMRPVPGLLARVESAVRAHPDAALALFAFWSSRNGAAVRLGALSGARWVRAVNEWMPTNAVVLPRVVAAEFVAWAGQRRTAWPADVALHRFLRAHGVPSYVAVPNLVEHEETRSLVDNDYQGLRRAACFLPAGDGTAGGVEPLREPSAVPFFLAFTTAAARVVVPVPGSVPPRTKHVQAAEYLERFGVDVARLHERTRPRVAGVADDITFAAWLTAYTMGVVNQADGCTAVSLDDPVLRAALGTMVQGGVSHRVGAATAGQLAEALEPVVLDGLATGLGAFHGHRAAAGPRIGVVGDDAFLTEYLVARLAETGRTVDRVDPGTPALPGTEVAVLVGPCAWAAGIAVTEEEVARQAEWTRELLAARGGARVVLLSSYRVYDGCAGEVDEETPLTAGDPVATAIRAVEQVCQEAGALVLRLGTPYGPGMPHGNAVTAMAGNASTSLPIRAGTGGWPIQLVHLADVAAAVTTVVDGPPADPVLNVSNVEPLYRADLVDIVSRVVRPVPDEPAAGPGTVNPVNDNPVVDGARVRKLGWQPTVDVEHGVFGLSQWLAHDTSWEPDARRAGR